ncbi:MAG: ABC transporter permease [Rhodospirillaceae bacterium]
MNFELIVSFIPDLLEGAVLTIQLVALSVAIGFVLAIPTALARLSENPLLRGVSFLYIFFFRGTPLLVQIALVYYGLAQFDAVRESIFWPILKQPFWCAIIAFSLNTGAYSGEILRGAMKAIPKGEIEAAKAYGMRGTLLVRRILLPRAFQIGLPAYGNEIILMVKGSALASTITLLDITGVARTLFSKHYTPIEAFASAGVLYLILVWVLTRGLKALERRLLRHQQPREATQAAEAQKA